MPFYKIHELPQREVIPGYTARTVHTGQLTLVYWLVTEGARMPVHQHPHEQVAHVLEGTFELQVGDELRVLEPGVIAVIPPHIPHGGKALTACSLLDVFYPEREDYKFESPDEPEP
ncbi:MAG TPA: cupin domain-containing protein [Chitinophagaceae bacterium]|jgi:quercetin dioxygenase-like cupin family protein|nr:cupin domain-containing protein [Chitinophagaceae bacterium]